MATFFDPTQPPPGAPLPLTEAQEGMLYAQRLDPANPIYNTGQYLDIRGSLDIESFRRAVEQALAEATALAVRIEDAVDGMPYQVLDERQRAHLDVQDLRTERDPEGVALRKMARDMATPLDLSRDPLAAEVLFVLEDQRCLWYQRVHHLAIDGYGVSLLTKRVCDLYSAFVADRPPASQPFGAYEGLLREDATYRESAKREADRAFWIECFGDRPEVASLVPASGTTSRTYLRLEVPLPPTFETRLKDLASRAGCPWPDAVVTLVGVYLKRHIGDADAVLGVPSMERLGTAAARVPAMVMNVIPLRVAVDEDADLAAFVKTTAEHLRAQRRHARYRSEQLRRDLGLLGGRRRLYGPLVNVLPFERVPELAGVHAIVNTLGTGPVDDLTLNFRAGSGGSGLRLDLDANPGLYSEEVLRQHAARLAHFLNEAASAVRVSDVQTLTPAEYLHWTAEVNGTDHPVESITLTDMIEASLRRTPEAEALTSEEESLSYAELDRRTTALAAELRSAGVRRGDIVAIALPRSIDLVLALVSTLRAGAAYLPIDISNPDERIAHTLGLARPRIVITLEGLRSRLPSSLPVLTLGRADAYWSARRGDSDATPEVASPADAAYVIYTSGSTGEPKGVVVQHHAIVNRLEWMRAHYAITPADRILQKTPATFDVSVWEFFLPLIAGATLVVAPPDAHRDPAWLAALVRKHRITTMHFVPSMLAVFIEEPSAGGLSLRRVFCSGEELPASLRDRFHARIQAELHNLYGPTEAAVDVTFWDASRGDRSSPVPIGYPVWNTQMYVLDSRLRPVPPGVPGDLYIGGVQLAREYLHRDDLTQQRFLEDPFSSSGGRLYRTGDIARWRDDGAIVFLGRSDHQVKIRGFRVELGEIEAAVLSSGLVAQTAVVALEPVPGDKQLVAYLVPARGVAFDVAALRDAVMRRLPEYMVPSAFMTLDELPLTRSGKLDRAALPVLSTPDRAGGRAPETAVEQRLAALFADVLTASLGRGVEHLSAEDDFFALGGHSLAAARLMALVREEWGGSLGIGTLFVNPTIAQLAGVIENEAALRDGNAGSGLAPLLRLVEGGPSETALFCIHPAGGLAWCYGSLARAISPRRTVYGVQAPTLDPAQPIPARLEDLAAGYVDLIRAQQPNGPYHLAGWSIGGIIAHAMAVRLQQLGAEVGTVAMLDAYPSDRWRAQPEPGPGAALRAILLIAGHDPASLEDVPLTREEVMAFLRRSGHALGELSDEALAGVIRVVESNNKLVREFYHRPFDGSIVYFRAALDHADDGLVPEQWQPYVTGSIEVHDVQARHAHLTGPEATAAIAPVLSGRMEP